MRAQAQRRCLAPAAHCWMSIPLEAQPPQALWSRDQLVWMRFRPSLAHARGRTNCEARSFGAIVEPPPVRVNRLVRKSVLCRLLALRQTLDRAAEIVDFRPQLLDLPLQVRSHRLRIASGALLRENQLRHLGGKPQTFELIVGDGAWHAIVGSLAGASAGAFCGSS